MPIATRCPNCRAPFRLGDEMAGKKVKCQKCQSIFVVPNADEVAAPAAGASSSKKPTIDMELDLQTRPDQAKVAARPPDDEGSDGIMVDDAEPARPSGKKPPPPPSGKKPPAKPPAKARPMPRDSGFSMAMMALMVLLVGGGLFSCVGCVGALGWWFYADSPLKPNPGPIAAADKAGDAKKDRDKQADGNKDRDKINLEKKVDGNKDRIPFDGKKIEGPPFDGFKNEDKKLPPTPPPGGINVVFGPDGSYRSENVLSQFDPVNQFGKRHKLYVVQMEAGQTYQIDLVTRSDGYDPYLHLVDDANQLVAQDDDGGGFPNARIVYRAPRAARYRIHATYFGGLQADANFTLFVRRAIGGVVKNPDIKPPDEVAVGDMTTRTILFKKEAGKILGNLVWARDGKTFYALNENGLLQRINAATGNTEKKHDHARRCGNLALSGEGLLLSMLDAQEVWVVDPDNLGTVKKKIAVPSVARVTAGVNAKIAVAASAGSFGRGGMNVIDLLKGAVVQQYPNFGGLHLIASPDGNYVFAQGGIEQLQRYRLEGQQLIQEDSSPRIASNGQSICVSPDSQYVCLPAGGGNGNGHPDHPPAGAYATYIYPVTNLKRPAFAIASGAYPQAVGFDPKNGVAFAQNFDKALLVYTFTGIKRSEHAIPGVRGGDVREFSVPPQGFEVLLRTNDRVIHAKLKAGKALGKDDSPPDPKIDPALKAEIGKSVRAATLALGNFAAKDNILRDFLPDSHRDAVDGCPLATDRQRFLIKPAGNN
jgi:predicted Zn finger-like uncharacterized protein